MISFRKIFLKGVPRVKLCVSPLVVLGISWLSRRLHGIAKPKVLVLCGPTGVGKTEISLGLAESLNGEIISADSVAVYKHLNVGVSKPSKEIRSKIRHHILDIVEPKEEFTVSQFSRMAKNATEEILSEKKVPIVVGGTGFYIRWYLQGHPGEAPATSIEQKERLSKMIEELGRQKCYERLKEIDPEFAARIDHNDIYRIIRGLSVFETTGKPYSFFRKASASSPIQNSSELQYDFRCVVLSPPRLFQCRIIDYRCEKMLQEGLLDEVAYLLRSGILPLNSVAARSIGYRHAIQFLQDEKFKERDLIKFLGEFSAASRQFSGRQITWFKQEKLFYPMNIISNSKTNPTLDIDLKSIIKSIVDLYEMPFDQWQELLATDHQNRKDQTLYSEEKKQLQQYQSIARIFTNSGMINQFLDSFKKSYFDPDISSKRFE